MRAHGHVRISRSKPQAQGICDRCGMAYTHRDLRWQFDWVGARVQNKRILVCSGCNDKPQENIRTIILPPDPRGIPNPRPENFVGADNPLDGLGGWSPQNLFGPPNQVSSAALATTANFGNMKGGRGPDGVFDGSQFGTTSSGQFVTPPAKFAFQGAVLNPSSTGANFVGKNWSLSPGAPASISPSSVGVQTQAYAVNGARVTAPLDGAFLGSSLTATVNIEGSNDAAVWTVLGSIASVGAKGESLNFQSSNLTIQSFFAYHRVNIVGDGVNRLAIASVSFFVSGPSNTQTASELGA